ncbi:MAG: c-type cytochrome, partial [Anaerolineae bacterium]
HRVIKLVFIVLSIVLLGLAALSASAAPSAQGDAEQGAYIFALTAGCGCHTSEAGALAGNAGFQMEGPFGAVSFPNITPDPETGVGDWSDQEIIDAIRLGTRPDGRQLFPMMPYPAFSGMSDQDVQDLVAYLRTVEPVKNAVPSTELTAPMPPFKPPVPPPAVAPTEGVARGEYLVNAVTACGDCHTPRNPDGSPDMSKFMAGAFSPEAGGVVPNITPDEETGIGGWTEEQIATLIRTGKEPDGSQAEGMAFLIEDGWKDMTESDALAIAAYLKTVPAVKNVPQAPQEVPKTGGAKSSGPVVAGLMALVGAAAVASGFVLRRRRYRGV